MNRRGDEREMKTEDIGMLPLNENDWALIQAALDTAPRPLDKRLYDLCYAFAVMVSEHNGHATHGQGASRLPTHEQYKEWVRKLKSSEADSKRGILHTP